MLFESYCHVVKPSTKDQIVLISKSDQKWLHPAHVFLLHIFTPHYRNCTECCKIRGLPVFNCLYHTVWWKEEMPLLTFPGDLEEWRTMHIHISAAAELYFLHLVALSQHKTIFCYIFSCESTIRGQWSHFPDSTAISETAPGVQRCNHDQNLALSTEVGTALKYTCMTVPGHTDFVIMG